MRIVTRESVRTTHSRKVGTARVLIHSAHRSARQQITNKETLMYQTLLTIPALLASSHKFRSSTLLPTSLMPPQRSIPGGTRLRVGQTRRNRISRVQTQITVVLLSRTRRRQVRASETVPMRTSRLRPDSVHRVPRHRPKDRIPSLMVVTQAE